METEEASGDCDLLIPHDSHMESCTTVARRLLRKWGYEASRENVAVLAFIVAEHETEGRSGQ